jgi:hypothetical protein
VVSSKGGMRSCPPLWSTPENAPRGAPWPPGDLGREIEVGLVLGSRQGMACMAWHAWHGMHGMGRTVTCQTVPHLISLVRAGVGLPLADGVDVDVDGAIRIRGADGRVLRARGESSQLGLGVSLVGCRV